MKTCKVEVCQRPVTERGYCHGHYDYWRRNGVRPTHLLRTDLTVAERFLLKTTDGRDGCVVWTGAAAGGYGAFHLDRRMRGAHRVAYELFVGPIPEGLVLDHLCRNTLCVNPDHLEPVTQITNVLRGESYCAKNARKTHCSNGHEYTPENTGIEVTRSGRSYRRCLTCRSLRNRKAAA